MLEKQKLQLENVNNDTIVMEVVEQGNQGILSLAQTMSDDRKNEILDTFEEIQANNDEIADRISSMVGGDLSEDEELEQQLAELMNENNQEQILQPTSSVLNFPSVPLAQVNQAPARPSRVNDEEEALRALGITIKSLSYYHKELTLLLAAEMS